ncbi:MAG: response regulator transcription factor [Bacteroidota bacterium]
MSASIRVVLADDHRIVREGIRDRLAAEADIEVVGEAADGKTALRLVRDVQPDVVVLDVEMPEMTGVEVARAIATEGLASRVLVLSGYDDAEYVGALLDAGAAGYLTKDESLKSIVEAVRGIASGEDGWLSRRIAAQVVSLRRQPAEAGTPGGLTPREIDVLRLVARGRTNAEAAGELHVSEYTVRNHLASVYSKLAVSNRAEATAWAWRTGLVEG